MSARERGEADSVLLTQARRVHTGQKCREGVRERKQAKPSVWQRQSRSGAAAEETWAGDR